MVEKARIIILNGVGSAGKSAIAKALQGLTGNRFLHVQMDGFLEMMPEARWGHPDWFSLETLQEEGRPSIEIRTGPLGQRLMRGMRRAIAALAGEGNDMIVDEVMEEPVKRDYETLLAGFDAAFVGVLAPLDVLEARERARDDRMIGLARRQFARIHKSMRYDFEVDTSLATPLECGADQGAVYALNV
ncbi:MAG TPA: chloramphenicol phosphotransferase [Dongiaceae bacterium]|nr:chloramphenicol phosphotransferase [Dongiaceae bacterium]